MSGRRKNEHGESGGRMSGRLDASERFQEDVVSQKDFRKALQVRRVSERWKT